MPVRPFYSPRGGFETEAIYSGQVAPALTGTRNGAFAVGSDVMFCSGTGRLNAIIPHQTVFALSGVAGTIYDAARPVSGGPIAASGHIPLGNILALPAGNKIALSGDQLIAGVPQVIDVPFQSGLCYNSRSGQTGVTFVWTREDQKSMN